MKIVPLGELMADDVEGVDPRLAPDEEFELWSIPSYDAGSPEVRFGSEIGSAKKRVQPNDVLLSRIVPHLRRAWVVGRSNGRQQIASSEWIVFRSDRFSPEYLRHFLLSDVFHPQFMKTVAGVGGSLLRARPDGVAHIELALPPLDEQRRIAAILDQADALRRKREMSLANIKNFGRALFVESFGTIQLPKRPHAPLGNIATFKGGGTPSRACADYYEGDICWASSKDMTSERICDTQERVSESAIENSATNLVPAGTVLVVVKSKILMRRLPVTVVEVPMCFNQDIKAILPVAPYSADFVMTGLLVNQDWLLQKARGANTEGLTLDHLKGFPIPTASKTEIDEFDHIMQLIRGHAQKLEHSLQKLENIFSAIRAEAFGQGTLLGDAEPIRAAAE